MGAVKTVLSGSSLVSVIFSAAFSSYSSVIFSSASKFVVGGRIQYFCFADSGWCTVLGWHYSKSGFRSSIDVGKRK